MNIQQIPTDKIIPYARNPRKNDTAVDAVAASIKEFGFRQPIVVAEDMVVLVGHTRLKAAIRLGMAEVPVHIATGLTETQKKAYRIADNRTSELAEWDSELLALELEDLRMADFDLGTLAFEDGEINALLASLEATPEGETDADAVPEPQDEVVAQPGDVWVMGKHRIMCGDSTVATDVAALLGGGVPHLMVTDPPYGVEYDADWRNHSMRADGSGIGTRAVGKVLNDHNADWREAWALFPGEVAYVWHAGTKANIVADSLLACGFDIRAQVIWAKSQLVIGRGHYHPKHEPCWYAVKKGGTGHWQGDRKQTTLWEINKPQKSETGHSTQKPIECMRRPIENNSQPGDSIYEPFSGSGTTIIAAEQTGRRCYAMEISPLYVQVALDRWANFTGKDPVREADGVTWSSLKSAIK